MIHSSASSTTATPPPPSPVPKAAESPAIEPPPQKVEVVTAFTAPSGIVKAAENAGAVKGNLSVTSMLIQGFLGGLYIALGGMVAIAVGKNTGNLPGGLSKLLFGATFPVGLILVVVAGAELVTGNMATLIPAWLNGRIRWWQLLNNWLWVYVGNFVGALFCALVLAFSTNLYGADPYLTAVQGIAHLKCKENTWYQNFALGIGCNMLVALAIFMSMAAKDVASKVLCIWFPIQTFVTIGFEHCVANMFFVTVGIMYGADVSFGRFLGSNLVPVTLGNLVGASIFVGLIYWYLYGLDQQKCSSCCCCVEKKASYGYHDETTMYSEEESDDDDHARDDIEMSKASLKKTTTAKKKKKVKKSGDVLSSSEEIV